jgi:hypothetical protein
MDGDARGASLIAVPALYNGKRAADCLLAAASYSADSNANLRRKP